MNLFTIDQNKCKQDGICAKECPVGIISFSGKGSFPAPVEGTASLCINCGHCVAVCPHGAFSLQTMKSEDCAPVQKDQIPGPDSIEHFLVTRRSIRRYKDQPVDRDTLSRLINMASYAPSGHNSQPVNWLVIENKDEVHRLAGLVIDWMRHMVKENPGMALPMHMDKIVDVWDGGKDRICRGAPHVIVAHSPKTLMTAPAACYTALTYLELSAYAMGLGACWAGYFYAAANFYPPMQQALGLPEGHSSFGAMLIGHPQYRYHRVPLRNKPKITWR